MDVLTYAGVCVCVGALAYEHRHTRRPTDPMYRQNPATAPPLFLLSLLVPMRWRHSRIYPQWIQRPPKQTTTKNGTQHRFGACQALLLPSPLPLPARAIGSALPYHLLLDHAEIKWCHVGLKVLCSSMSSGELFVTEGRCGTATRAGLSVVS